MLAKKKTVLGQASLYDLL